MSSFQNPYAPVVETYYAQTGKPLADLGKRFLGAILDGLVPFVAMLPGIILFVVGTAQTQGPNGPSGDISALGIVGIIWLAIFGIAFFVLQIYLLATRSQTVGKYLAKTQIADFNTGEPAGFVKSCLLRMIVSGLIGAIPLVGPIYSIADILFIFRADRRCLHDLIAGTKVVDLA